MYSTYLSLTARAAFLIHSPSKGQRKKSGSFSFFADVEQASLAYLLQH